MLHGVGSASNEYAPRIPALAFMLFQLMLVDRIVALPELRGPAVRGLPHDVTGFLPVDEYGRVTGVHGVWAAGDCTDYPIKQGGVAAQQADAVALSIAERAGASVMPEAFKPVLTGILLTGEKPMRLGADPGAAGPSPDPGVAPGLPQAAKIAARYLAPHLEQPVKLRA
jgi:sulfide:quinone oxidoreductase